MTFLQSEITDLPARDKIRYSGSLDFTDRPALVKYAYLRASSRADGAQRVLKLAFSRDILNISAFGLSFCRDNLAI